MPDFDTIPTPPPMPGALDENPGALSFSFKGRANRARYWGGTLFVEIVCGTITAVIIGMAGAKLFNSEGEPDIAMCAGILGPAIPIVIVSWIWMLSMQVRRLHDHDKSGWFVVAFWAAQFIPFVGYLAWLWPFIWLGCMKGTNGPNRYGPDPLE